MKPSPAASVCYERGVQVRGIQVFDPSEPVAAHVLAAVATGGAIGAGGRWFIAWALTTIGGAPPPGSWPWPTLIVNIVGSVLIGFTARGYDRDTVFWAFAVTGMLGGFTTFSAFAVEVNDMADAGRLPLALAYVAVTVIGGLVAVAVAGSRRQERPRP